MFVKKYLLVILFLLPAIKFIGQNFSFGPELGLTLSPVAKTDVEKITYKEGFYGGAYLQYHFSDRFSAQLGLFASTTSKTYGYTQTDSAGVSDFVDLMTGGLLNGVDTLGLIDTSYISTFTDNLNTSVTTITSGNSTFTYIKMPLSVVYSLNKNLAFSFGPYISYLVASTTREEMKKEIPLFDAMNKIIDSIPPAKAMIKGTFPGYTEPEFDETSSTDEINPVDYGLTAGITYMSDNNIFFSLKYSFGLEEVYIHKPEEFSIYTNKHSMAQITIGYKLGKKFTKISSEML